MKNFGISWAIHKKKPNLKKKKSDDEKKIRTF